MSIAHENMKILQKYNFIGLYMVKNYAFMPYGMA